MWMYLLCKNHSKNLGERSSQKYWEGLLLQVPMEETIGRKLGRELDSKGLCDLGERSSQKYWEGL